MKVFVAAVLAAAVLTSNTARADFKDGNRLYADCTAKPREPFSDGTCLGYIVGVADTFRDLAAIGAINKTVCMASNVTAGQVGDVVEQYLTAHPQERHHTAASNVVTALQAAFPCAR